MLLSDSRGCLVGFGLGFGLVGFFWGVLVLNLVLILLWVLSIGVYSFTSDYALTFKNHGNKAVPWIRWGTLLMAMGLSLHLAQTFQGQLQGGFGNGLFVIFVIVVFGVILLAKFLFRWVIKRRLDSQ